MSASSSPFTVSRFVWLAAAGTLLAYWMAYRPSPPKISLPPEEDAFVSFFQAAHGLAKGLVLFQSKLEFEQQVEKIDHTVDELVACRERLLALSAEDREWLSQEHAELVQQTKDACQALETRHAAKPEILGDRWHDYWANLQLQDVIESE